MSVQILMNNQNKFKVDGTLEDLIEKIKSEQVLKISHTLHLCDFSKHK
ncbi:MAG: hypothetical protein H7Y18_14795 [Clostridiaceae bacterium]|nr:hypothetical protein [Clostridiaceae bacterium]